VAHFIISVTTKNANTKEDWQNTNKKTKKLVLKGDRSISKAIPLILPIVIFCIVFGTITLLLIQNGVIDPRIFTQMFGIRTGRTVYTIVYYGGMILGWVIILIGGVVIPILMLMNLKLTYVDVYEDRVCGAYVENMQAVPFELTYDKIESIHYKKHLVYIQISGRTLQTHAFNAKEIVNAVNERRS